MRGSPDGNRQRHAAAEERGVRLHGALAARRRAAMSERETEAFIAAARASDQSEFEWLDGDRVKGVATFMTGVSGAPLHVLGLLGADGQWRLLNYVITAPGPPADEIVEALASRPPPGFKTLLVLRNEPVAEAMVRQCIRTVLTDSFNNPGAADTMQTFMQSLRASRFAGMAVWRNDI
jgi:hypothetical protein